MLLGNIVVLIIFLVASYFDLFWWVFVNPPIVSEPPTSKKDLGLVCRSIRCGIAGTTLYYALNHSAEPCDSMLGYVCERWVHEHKENYHKVVLGAEKRLMEEMYIGIQRILESPHLDHEGSTALRKAAYLYNKCQKSDTLGRVERLEQMRSEYALQNWPFQGPVKVDKPEDYVAKYIHDTGSGVFVTVRVIPDPEDPNRDGKNIVTLECSTFSVPVDTLLMHRDSKKEVIKAYKNLIQHTLDEFRGGDTVAVASNIFAFEVNLAHRCAVQCHQKPLQRVTLKDLQISEDQISGIDWTKFLSTIFEGANITFAPDTAILVRSKAYLKRLNFLFRDRSTKTKVMNYLGWRFMSKFARHTGESMRKEHARFSETVVGQENGPRWKTCLMDVAEAMPLALGRLYMDYMQWEVTDFRAFRLVMSVINSLEHMLFQFKWVEGGTKEKLKALLTNMKFIVGYPTLIRNNTWLDRCHKDVHESGSYVDALTEATKNNAANNRDPTGQCTGGAPRGNLIFPSRIVELYGQASPEAKLFYDISDNIFVLPTGVLTPPFYSRDTTGAVNFGGLGMLVAREIVNEFLPMGSSAGNWMTDTEKGTFSKGSDCVLSSVRKVSTKDAGESNMREAGVVQELLALRVAYTAYHSHVDYASEGTLPGLEEMSPDQVFFVAAFRTLCTRVREKKYMDVVKSRKWVAELDFLDALVRGMNEFADAFNCGAFGERENVVQQCLVWGSPSAKYRARKRTLWRPPSVNFTTVEAPFLTTQRRTLYKRRYNRTVFKRPYESPKV